MKGEAEEKSRHFGIKRVAGKMRLFKIEKINNFFPGGYGQHASPTGET